MAKTLILGHASYGKAFDPSYFNTKTVDPINSPLDEILDSVKLADLICFTGGEDVNPVLYGASSHHVATHVNLLRDHVEKVIYDYALPSEKPMIGICRGAQFLNVMAGGKLIQHIESHHGSHMAKSGTDGETEIVVTSDHHQLMAPGNVMVEYELLLYSTQEHLPTDTEFYDYLPWDPEGEEFRVEPEVLLFRDKKLLCHQPHPEWADINSPYWEYFNFTARNLMSL